MMLKVLWRSIRCSGSPKMLGWQRCRGQENNLHHRICMFQSRQIAMFLTIGGISSVQSLSRVWLFVTPWTAACQAPLSITNSRSLLRLMSIESVMPSNHLSLCCPLFLLSSTFPSNRVFSNESVLHIRWPKYWSVSFNMSFQWILRTDFLEDWLVWSPCSSTDFQESSPTPQFKSINSSALSFLHSPTLTSIHDHWKNHSLD